VLKGTPTDLAVQSDAGIEDFHRYDLTDSSPLQLSAHCEGRYSSTSRAFSSIACRAPAEGGFLTLAGSIGLAEHHSYDLTLAVRDVPVQALVGFARHAKKGIPADLTALGVLDGGFEFARAGGRTETLNWTGRGAARGARITSKLAKADVLLDRVPFSISKQG